MLLQSRDDRRQIAKPLYSSICILKTCLSPVRLTCWTTVGKPGYSIRGVTLTVIASSSAALLGPVSSLAALQWLAQSSAIDMHAATCSKWKLVLRSRSELWARPPSLPGKQHLCHFIEKHSGLDQSIYARQLPSCNNDKLTVEIQTLATDTALLLIQRWETQNTDTMIFWVTSRKWDPLLPLIRFAHSKQ